MFEVECTDVKEEPVENSYEAHQHIPVARFEEDSTFVEAYNDHQLQPLVVMKRLNDARYLDFELSVNVEAENSIKSEDEEYIQASAEHNLRDAEDGKDYFHPRENDFPHASEKAQNSHVKKVLKSDTVVTNTDSIIVTEEEFTEPFSSPGTFGCVNREKTPGEMPSFSGNDVEPCDLERHATVHMEEKTYSCSFCDKKFPTKYQHETHELHHKGEVHHFIKCGTSKDTCGNGNRENTLGALPETLTNHTPYSCNFCDRKFRTKYEHPVCISIEKRTLVHSAKSYEHRGELPQCPDRKYQCKVCGFMFKRPSHLERHATIHTGIKPFKCSFCDKFRTDYQHKMHELGHKGRVNLFRYMKKGLISLYTCNH